MESPQARELNVKRATPRKKSLAWPTYSATLPKIISKLVRVTRYEVMIICDWARLTPKYSVMVGRAMLTTEPSTTAMRMPAKTRGRMT